MRRFPLALLLLAACAAPATEAPVREGLNDNFLSPELDVEQFTERFEGESREVYREREELLGLLGLTKGMAVADVGAGTGAFAFPMSGRVGPTGRVDAVEISDRFLEHLAGRAQLLNTPWVVPVRGTEKDPNLAPESLDRIWCCDTYHHFTYPLTTTRHLLEALRPGGEMILVDFERIEGVSREWLLGHVRAGKEVVLAEIQEAGFEFVEEIEVAGLEENYVLRFRRPLER